MGDLQVTRKVTKRVINRNVLGKHATAGESPLGENEATFD